MQADTARTRHGLLLVVASASVTVAVAVTIGTLTGYLHAPRSAGSPAVEAAVTAPSPRTVLVPVLPDGPAVLDETREPRLVSVHSEERRARHERNEEHEDDDD